MSSTTFYNSTNLVGIGSVGIGTTSTTTQSGFVTSKMCISAESTGSGAPQLSLVGANNTNNVMALGYCTTTAVGYGYIQPYQSGTGYRNLALCDSGGNVGIGTTNPAAPLHVISAGTAINLSNTAAQTVINSQIGRINFGNGGSDASIASCVNSGGANNNTDLRFYTSLDYVNQNLERMRIDRSGNVGIGVTNPGSILSVLAGAAYGRMDCSGDSIELGAGRTSDGSINIDFHTAEATYSDYSFRIIRASGANGAAEIDHRGTGDLVYKSVDAGAQIWYTTNTERMRLTAGGNVGIGTNNPTYQLTVASNIYNQSSGGGFYGMSCGNLDSFIQGVYNGGAANPDGLANSDLFIGNNYNQQTGLRVATTNHGSSQIQLVGANPGAGRINIRCAAAGTGALSSVPIVATFTVNGVGIGTTNPLLPLTISAAAGQSFEMRPSSGNSCYGRIGNTVITDGSPNCLLFGADTAYPNGIAFLDTQKNGTAATAPLAFRMNGTEYMRVHTNGYVGIGTASPVTNFHVDTGATQSSGDVVYIAKRYAGNYCLNINSFSATYPANFISFHGGAAGGDNPGQITATNSTTMSYGTGSDYRIKSNVVPLSNSIEFINKLNPIYFTFNVDPTEVVGGFLAHEVQELIPSAVSGEKDAVDSNGNIAIQNLDNSFIIPYLTAAVQELSAENASLKQSLSSLEQSLATATANFSSLEARLAALEARLTP